MNFAVAMTDGYYNGSFSIANTDIDGTGPYDGGAYEDAYSDSMADIAMHYYERDLQTGLDDEVPLLPSEDIALLPANANGMHQHMVTYTIGFGVDGTLAAMPTDASTAFSWPDPQANLLHRIDDLRHASYNGRGDYISAETPAALEAALQNILSAIEENNSSASAVSFNAGRLSTDSRLVSCIIQYVSLEWAISLLSC